MNLIRSIKLLSLYDNLDEQEKFVINLFSDIHERKSENTISYIKDVEYGGYCFQYFIKEKEFTISSRLVWDVIEYHYSSSYQETNNLIRKVFEKALHTKDFTIYKGGKYNDNVYNEDFFDDVVDDDYYL